MATIFDATFIVDHRETVMNCMGRKGRSCRRACGKTLCCEQVWWMASLHGNAPNLKTQYFSVLDRGNGSGNESLKNSLITPSSHSITFFLSSIPCRFQRVKVWLVSMGKLAWDS